jgi:hypothetical protein
MVRRTVCNIAADPNQFAFGFSPPADGAAGAAGFSPAGAGAAGAFGFSAAAAGAGFSSLAAVGVGNGAGLLLSERR